MFNEYLMWFIQYFIYFGYFDVNGLIPKYRQWKNLPSAILITIGMDYEFINSII